MNNLKGVLRSATAMFLFVGLFGIWMGGCQTQEQKEKTNQTIAGSE